MDMPEMTDEWVADNTGEFETIDEWTTALKERISEQKLNGMRQGLVTKITDALTGLSEIEAPAPMVDSDLNQRVQNTMQQFQAQGIDFGQWMEMTGQEPEQFIESMRGQSEQAVKSDLALRAVAAAEDFEVEDHEIEGEYARMAMQYGQKAKEIRKAYEQNDAVSELLAQIKKNKALDWLVHNVDFVDENGAALDRDLVLGHTHDEDGNHTHDHNHDEEGTDETSEEAAES
jgi:trigger factor